MKLDNQDITYLIDSGVGRNYILYNYITQRRLLIKKKKEPYSLDLADRQTICYNTRQVDRETTILGL